MISDRDLLRERWRRELDRQSLDTVRREDFALGRLAQRLRAPSVQLLLLPRDPESEPVEIDESLFAWLRANQAFEMGGRVVSLGRELIPTAHAVALVDRYSNTDSWLSYLAVHRSGAVEMGLGDRGAFESDARDGTQARVFRLISIVARTWAMLRFVAVLRERAAPPLPYQLTVGIYRTGGAFLGNVGEGWAEPMSLENDVVGCADSHLLWHIELEEWPDDDRLVDLAFKVGDRVEDAWGVSERRYLAHRGDRAGRLDVSRLRE